LPDNKEEADLKRTRRIEIVRYSRRVTLSSVGDAPDRAEGPAINILLDALSDTAPAPEEFRHEAGAGRAPDEDARASPTYPSK
jgi:hypothetical protein